MAKKKKNLGAGAKVSILTRFLHNRATVCNFFPNEEANSRLKGLTVVRQKMHVVRRKAQLCLDVTHPTAKEGGEGQELIILYGCKKLFTVEEEGPPDQFFDALPAPPTPDDGEEVQGDLAVEVQEAIDDLQAAIAQIDGGDANIDIVPLLREANVMIDDDNEPLPENDRRIMGDIPVDSVMKDEWGHDGICNRKASGHANMKAKMRGAKFSGRDATAEPPTLLDFFEAMIPKEYFVDVILPLTSDKLGYALSYGEFLQWLGIWFLIATTSGSERRDFWSMAPPNRFKGAPFRVNDVMARDRFEAILSALTYCSPDSKPAQADRFWWNTREKVNKIIL